MRLIPGTAIPVQKSSRKKRVPNQRKSRSTKKKAGKATVRVPKGKRAGSVFTSGGKRYTVISYKSNSGKRVRYARKI